MYNRKLVPLLCVTALSFGFDANATTANFTLPNGIASAEIDTTGVDIANVNLAAGNNLETNDTADGGTIAVFISGMSNGSSLNVNNLGTLGNESSIRTSGDNAVPLYSFGTTSYNFTLNNNSGATIESRSTNYFYGTVFVVNGSGGTNTINNSGAIQNNGSVAGFYQSAIFFSRGNSVVNNSGTIQTASATDYAIRQDDASNSLTVNILAGSNINGKIRGAGSNNVLNIKKAVDANAFNNLVAQIDTSVGSWTTKIATDGVLTISGSKSVATVNVDDGSINNSGTITNATMVNSGTLTSSGTISNLTMSAGTATNSGTIANFTMSGGTTTNAGTIDNLTISSGTATNNNAHSITNLTMTGGTVNNAGLVAATVFTSGTLSNSGTILTLSFTNGGSYGNIANTGALTMNVATQNVDYGNALSGNGTITKTGAARLQLTGTSTHSGQFVVSGGELKVNGTTASQVVAGNGAVVSGSGTIGALTLQSGATLATGNSIGTLNVGGAVNLNAGSTTAIEFNNVAMDKTIATGNITVGGTAAFSLYNYSGNNYFVVSQNILETTGGTVSGTFDNTTISDDSFVVSTDYSSTAVRATISKKLNSSTLDAQLTLQNAVGRMVTKAVTDELNDYNYSKNTKAVMWISSSAINSNYAQLQTSSPYSVNGVLTSAGVAKKYNGLDLIGGIFNSRANANRFDYFGQDDTTTNGAVVGVGQSEKLGAGSLYNSMQIGVGFYNSNNTRNVAVNGTGQIARSETKGQFQYINFGTSYNLPITQTGQLSFSILAGVQQTSNAGFEERDLSYGNLTMGKSSASTINTELGIGYQDQFAKFLHLPNDSFYKFELTGYQSNLYHKQDAQVNQGNASYIIAAKYRQGMVFGANAYAVLPVNDKTSIVAKFSRRQNGTLRDSVGGVELRYQF